MQESFSESRTAVVELVHRYAFYIRTRQAEKCADLFVNDAVFEIRSVDPRDPDSMLVRQTLRGRNAIRDYVVKTQAHGLHICPLIFNMLVEVEGDRASSNAVMESRTWPPGHEVIGEYHDRFCRDENWLFESRVFTIFQTAAG